MSSKLNLVLTDIKNSRSERLDLQDRGLFNEIMEAIVEALNEKPKINELDLSINNLDDDCAAVLCKLKYVKVLTLSRNNFDKGTLMLVQHFESLNLSQNFLSQETAEDIIKSKDKIKCQALNIKNNDLQNSTLVAIDNIVKDKNSSLKPTNGVLSNFFDKVFSNVGLRL